MRHKKEYFRKTKKAFTTTQDIEVMIKREEQPPIYFQLREKTNGWGSVISSNMQMLLICLLHYGSLLATKMVRILKYPSRPPQRSILISKDIHRKPSPPSLVGSNPRQSWLLNPDLWLTDSSNGFTHSHTQIPPSYLFSICVNKILCYMSQQGQKEDKTPCNRAPRRCVTGQTTTRLHWRCAFLSTSSNKCQGRLSNNCCNPGDGGRGGAQTVFRDTHQTFVPFWSRHLCLTAC